MQIQRSVQRKKRKSIRLFLSLFILLAVLLCRIGSGITLSEYHKYDAEYHTFLALAQSGVHDLQTAASQLKNLQKNPFDSPSVSTAQKDFGSASSSFQQVYRGLLSLPPIIASVPGYGTRFIGALHLLPLAIEGSQSGESICSLLTLLISRFHNPLASQSGDLTMTDFHNITNTLNQVIATFALMVDQVNHLGPNDLQLDPRLSGMVALFHKELPNVEQWLGQFQAIFPLVPALLGIGTPANFLVEILDSTELRPGGGFIGNYGIATLSDGRIAGLHITDTYLLDRPFEASGKAIPYPATYSWFDLAPHSWTLRDSNLDADFPTAARYSESNFKLEGGNVPVQGVFAVTPALIQKALLITGPISVPEYNETVTAQNLIDRIHFHQLGPAGEGTNTIASSDGVSSVRKHFTAVLGEHFLERVRKLSSAQLPKFLQLMLSSLHSKDLQVYLNTSLAEKLLAQYHFDASIQSPSGDSLFVVDANYSPNKANQFITNILNDQVTIDLHGNVFHHTTITYAWLKSGDIYGSPLYRDYLRIYTPPNSVLRSQSGWTPHGASTAFDRRVWAGYFTLLQGQTQIITLDWSVPHGVTFDGNHWHYAYLVQRQAGSQWLIHMQVSVASCSVITSTSGADERISGQLAAYNGSLTQDVNTEINYTAFSCQVLQNRYDRLKH